MTPLPESRSKTCVQFGPVSVVTSASKRGCVGEGVFSRERGRVLGCVDVGSEWVYESGYVVLEASERVEGSEVCAGTGAENVQVCVRM